MEHGVYKCYTYFIIFTEHLICVQLNKLVGINGHYVSIHSHLIGSMRLVNEQHGLMQNIDCLYNVLYADSQSVRKQCFIGGQNLLGMLT